MAMNRKQRENKLNKLFKHFGKTCHWCGTPLKHRAEYKAVKGVAFATVDHVIPKKFGGENHLWNLRASCPSCNMVRDQGWKTNEHRAFKSCPLITQHWKRLKIWLPKHKHNLPNRFTRKS